MKREAGVTLIEVLIAITLLSLLSVAMLFALRVGLNAMGKTNDRMTANRRVLGVERILTEQLAGFVPARANCSPTPDGRGPEFSFFQGDPQTMRFISTYSLQEASRGYPQILEFQVVPGEEGRCVRLVVNELLYTGPFSTGMLCGGMGPDPATSRPMVLWRPVQIGSASFVLADKLAACRFSFKEERPPEQPDLWHPRWPHDWTPSAVRIELLPLEPEAGRLQVPPVIVAPLHVDRRLPEYSDL